MFSCIITIQNYLVKTTKGDVKTKQQKQLFLIILLFIHHTKHLCTQWCVFL